MKKILVTGASGFVGASLCKRLETEGLAVRAAIRSVRTLQPGIEGVLVGDISMTNDWSLAMDDVVQVVHLAARVHVMRDTSSDPLTEFRRVNVDGTASFALQAAAAGVQRFVFLSSIKVNGESTELGRPFTADDPPAPEDPYGVSKHEAELLLRQIAADTGMEMVIIRPPLVYGPGVKSNFESMMKWLSCGVPLPLAAVTQNRRSFVALDNLVDLISVCLSHPSAANQTFLVSDGEDISTSELLNRLCAAMRRPARLYYLPPALVKRGATVLNMPSVYQRLCGSLQLDISKTRQLLGWIPPVSLDEGLWRAAEGFRR